MGGTKFPAKDQTAFLKKTFFQKPFRTSLGLRKHVLHLVWSDPSVFTDINIALKLASQYAEIWPKNSGFK